MWFSLTPCDLQFIAHAPYKVENKTVIAAPAEKVWDALADIRTWPNWFAELKSAQWTSAEPHGVGSRREVHLRRVSLKERFVAWEPGTRLAFTMEAVTLPLTSKMLQEWALEPSGQGTRVHNRLYYAPTSLTRVVHPVLHATFDKMFKDSLAALARYVVP